MAGRKGALSKHAREGRDGNTTRAAVRGGRGSQMGGKGTGGDDAATLVVSERRRGKGFARLAKAAHDVKELVDVALTREEWGAARHLGKHAPNRPDCGRSGTAAMVSGRGGDAQARRWPLTTASCRVAGRRSTARLAHCQPACRTECRRSGARARDTISWRRSRCTGRPVRRACARTRSRRA